METLCLILIILHLFITIFNAVSLHPHLSLIANGNDHRQRNLAIIHYAAKLSCILLFHVSSIVAVWNSRRSGAGVVRATGILLLGELLYIFVVVIEHAIDVHHAGGGELVFNIVHMLLLLVAVIMTFRIAGKLFKRRNDFMRAELLDDTFNNISIGNTTEPTFI